TIGMMFQRTDRAKFIDWPSAVYCMHPFDKVTVDGETVGVSTWIGYTVNEGKMLTLAVLDAEHAEPGTEVTFVWGEEDGGSAKPTVEPHEQAELRAVVRPGPHVEAVRRSSRRVRAWARGQSETREPGSKTEPGSVPRHAIGARPREPGSRVSILRSGSSRIRDERLAQRRPAAKRAFG